MRQIFSHKVKAFFLTAFLLGQVLPAETNYKIHVSSIEIPRTREVNRLSRPFQNDYIVHWQLYTLDADDQAILTDSRQIPDYRVYVSRNDSTFTKKTVVVDSKTDSALVKGLEIGKDRYYFRVEGLRDGQVVAASDVGWVSYGLKMQFGNKIEMKIPLFWPVADLLKLFGVKNLIYDNSTPAGKLAFSLIWYFVFAGLWIVFRRCLPIFRRSSIFPLVDSQKTSSVLNRLDKDYDYEQRLAPRFRFIIEAWKMIIDKINKANHSIKDTVTNSEQPEDQKRAQYNNLMITGYEALHVLRELLIFEYNDPEKDKKMNALIRQILKYFGPNSLFINLKKEPLHINVRNFKDKLSWERIEKDIKEPASARNLSNYPIAKVIAAGIENHMNNIFSWQQASGEVDRAIENRAQSEIQILQEHSSLDWLWNYGALAPLLGLFGTVTGITKVFLEISTQSLTSAPAEMVTKLAGGIFEALWTTIYGLVVGIVLMIVYYYFKNRLEWIYNKWMSLYVHITERL